MKKVVLTAIFILFTALSAFCGGDMKLVNTQEIELDNITDVKILYSSERISLFTGTTDKLIIKEYMTENNSKYFADIDKIENTVTIKKKRTYFSPYFRMRIEVYIPASYKNSINIKTASGNIETSDLTCSEITIVSSSGNILMGSIAADSINLRASSGRVELNITAGSVIAKTSSGNVNCTIGGIIKNMSVTTASGNVKLNLPDNYQFNFTTKTSSGRLSAPFMDKLFIPANNKDIYQGIIGKNDSDNIPAINIKTNSGNVAVNWI